MLPLYLYIMNKNKCKNTSMNSEISSTECSVLLYAVIVPNKIIK